MIKPNYRDGSIVNLVSSIRIALGGRGLYEPLKALPPAALSDRDIILIVIDGLGYDFLVKYGNDSFLHENLRGKMTSVFPSTTATAMTAFSTGLAAQQHGLTGWHVYLKEIGAITTVLPFTTRAAHISLSCRNIPYKEIINNPTEDLEFISSWVIKRKEYINSDYSRTVDGKANKLPFSTLRGLFRQIYKTQNRKGRRKFIFAYWDKFDSLCHEKGSDSSEAKEHFNEIDRMVRSLVSSTSDKKRIIIVSADHGQIITREKRKIIELKDHPGLTETLVLPLTGEPRVAYCYVRPAKVAEFENYVLTVLKDACELHKSIDLVRENYFGLYEPDKRLLDRIGDYTLIMKDNFIIKDLVLGERYHIHTGNHGGMSPEEMFVPLVVIG